MLFKHGRGTTKEIALRIPVDSGSPAHPRSTLLHAVLRWLELITSHELDSGDTARDKEHARAVDRSGGTDTSPVGGLALYEQTPGATAVVDSDDEEQARADAAITLLRLLCHWVHSCPAAVLDFLQNPANLFIVEVAAGRCPLFNARTGGGELTSGRGDPLPLSAATSQGIAAKGLACLVLGILLEFVEAGGDLAGPTSGRDTTVGFGGGSAEGASGGGLQWNRELLWSMIQKRIGEFAMHENCERMLSV